MAAQPQCDPKLLLRMSNPATPVDYNRQRLGVCVDGSMISGFFAPSFAGGSAVSSEAASAGLATVAQLLQTRAQVRVDDGRQRMQHLPAEDTCNFVCPVRSPPSKSQCGCAGRVLAAGTRGGPHGARRAAAAGTLCLRQRAVAWPVQPRGPDPQRVNSTGGRLPPLPQAPLMRQERDEDPQLDYRSRPLCGCGTVSRSNV